MRRKFNSAPNSKIPKTTKKSHKFFIHLNDIQVSLFTVVFCPTARVEELAQLVVSLFLAVAALLLQSQARICFLYFSMIRIVIRGLRDENHMMQRAT
jgi:hypothetical protein